MGNRARSDRRRRAPLFTRGPAPRDRILTAASRLFGEMGVRATGVDTLIESAGVAKGTFYRHFPSKDDLIVAWLEQEQTRWFDRIRADVEARTSKPEEVVPALFGAVIDWLQAGDFRGCPYLNTSVEIPDETHRAVPVVRSHLREIERYLQEAVAAAGNADSEHLGTELQTLLAGSISLGVAHRSKTFAVAARDAAIQLLELSH
jgi:AcrR family transcriptional regulator